MFLRPRRPTGPAAALVVALVTALLLGAVGALGVPAGVAADESSPGGSPPDHRGSASKFVVIDHNVQSRMPAVQEALDRGVRSGAPVILLQEVCAWQVREIREAHPRWTVAFQAGVDVARCKRTGLDGLGDRNRSDVGNVAIWTGGADGTISTHLFKHQGDRRPGRGTSWFREGVACVTWRATGSTRRACSTHLVNASRYTNRRGTQFRQARELKRLTKPWIRRGNVVIVGGDFNAAPQSRVLDLTYAADGNGFFHEATGCPRELDICRLARGTTFDGGKIKIDYIFFSTNRVVVNAPRRLSILPTGSDHHLLSGWAWLDLT